MNESLNAFVGVSLYVRVTLSVGEGVSTVFSVVVSLNVNFYIDYRLIYSLFHK